MHNLYCLPLGESYRAEMLQELLSEICTADQENRLFILPNAELFAKASQEALMQDPTCFGRVKILAFDSLVQEVLEKSAISRTFMSRMTQELLLKKIVDDLIERGALPYFQEMRQFPGFIRTVTSLIGEIKRSGTRPEEWLAAVQAKADELADQGTKDFEIALLYQAYQQELQALNLLDLEECYFLAIQALEVEPELLAYDTLYFSEFYIFTPLQMEFIALIKQKCTLKIALIYEKNRPEVYGPVETTYVALLGLGFSAQFITRQDCLQRDSAIKFLVNHLFNDKVINKLAAPCIEFVTVPHQTKELSVVGAYIKKQLLSGEIKPEEMAILVRDEGAYQGLFSLFKELKIPLNWQREEPLITQPLVRLLLNLLTARMDRGSKESVKALLSSSFVSEACKWDGDWLIRQAVGKRICHWEDWLQFMAEKKEETASFVELYRKIGTIPLQGDVGQLNAALFSLLQYFSPVEKLGEKYRSGLPLMRLKASLSSYKAIVAGLELLGKELIAVGLGEQKLSLSEYHKLLIQVFSSQTVILEPAHHHGVKVLSPAKARGVTFDSVCILGLTEGDFPQSVPENWLYNDGERKLFNDLGIWLNTAAKRRGEEKFYFAVSLALARKNLYLSGVANNETLLSPFLADVERIVSVLPEKNRKFAINEIFSNDYRQIYSEREMRRKAIWNRTQREISVTDRMVGEEVLRRFRLPDFTRKVLAQQSRFGEEESLFGGYVPSWERWHKSTAKPKVWNVSQLEAYINCPFAYFLRWILQPNMIEEPAETTEATVTGELYHRILSLFLAKYRGCKLHAEKFEEYKQEILAEFAALVKEWQEEGQLRIGRLWRYEAENIRQSLVRWLSYEVKRQESSSFALRPAYFEWGFGLKNREGTDRASVGTPLILQDEGQSLALGGKVDRIDCAGDHYVIYDYKKSGSPTAQETFEIGTDLQVPLYIAAVGQLLASNLEQVLGGAYYSIEGAMIKDGLWREVCKNQLGLVKIGGKCFLNDTDWLNFYQQFTKKIFTAAQAIAAGKFPVSPQICSKYCSGKGICRQGGEL